MFQRIGVTLHPLSNQFSRYLHELTTQQENRKKRRLFATSFTAFCEMVVTDNTRENVVPISGRNSFDSRDAFFDRVDYFRDPNFWEDYNIIEPTETLDKAINKLIKKYK